MYCKLFASLYQGTLRGRSNEILVFTNLLAHCDKEGFVDKHFRAIAEEIGIPVEDVKAAIEVLESPDPESRSPEYNGARLIRIDEHRAWGWQIVNYVKYRSIKDEDQRREANRIAQARWREKHKQASSNVISVSKSKLESAHAEADADTEGESIPKVQPTGKNSDALPTLEQVKNAAKNIGIANNIAETWFHECEGRGWVDGKGLPIRNWQSALTAYNNKWKANEQQRQTRQQKPKFTEVGLV